MSSEVVLLSGSVPALVAALELATVGIRVRIAAEVEPEMPAGRVRDRNGVQDRGGVLQSLLSEIAAPIAEGGSPAPEIRPVLTEHAPTLLRGRDGTWKPMPAPSVWGIPGVPVSYEAIGLLGTRAAMRAYVDRVKPVLTIGKEDNLAQLVTSRMGAKALKQLVKPCIWERFGVGPEEVHVGYVAPGLNEALTRTGSLSGAVLEYIDRHVARETAVTPASGWEAFGEFLLERLSLYGAERLEQPLGPLTYDESTQTYRGQDAAGTDWRFGAVISGLTPAHQPGIIEAVAEAAPKQRRIYAAIGIEARQAPKEAADGSETLEIAEDSQGNAWSVRVRENAPATGSFTAELASAAFDAAARGHSAAQDHSSAAAAGAGAEALARMAEVLGKSGFVDFVGPIGLANFENAVNVRAEAAPFVSHEQEDGAVVGVDAIHNAAPRLLLADADCYGADAALAVAEAQRAAVRLRRQLTGIAD